MKRFYYIIFLLNLIVGLEAQTSNKLIVKYFVKKDKVLFRIVPKEKTFYQDIRDKSLSIVRFDNVNGVLSNSVMINEMLRPYWVADSAKWLKLFREDKETASFVYGSIYPSSDKGSFKGEDKIKFDQMTYEMLLLSCNFDRKIAIAAGLYQADSSISNSKKYTYKLAIYTSSASGITTSLTSVDVDATILSPNKKIVDLKNKGKNNTSLLTWKATNYTGEYFGYNVYRSTDSVNFNRTNKTPVVFVRTQYENDKQFMTYKDTMPTPNKKYFYYIKGINLFGEESDPSNISSVFSVGSVISIPIIDSFKVIQNKMVKLHWRMNDPTETKIPVKYILQKSDKENSGYRSIFESSGDLNYLDKEVSKGSYYRVIALFQNNDSLFSFSRYATIIDTIPPSVPKNLKATVDKKGIVTISWKKSNEPDLQGYKLYRSNRPQDEFVQINEKFITDSFSTDKLNLRTLSKKIYYKVAASDNNYNTSTLSDPIEVKRPDTIPPQQPILVSVFQNTIGIVVKYILSSSEDIGKETLLRKAPNENGFKDYFSFMQKDSVGEILDTLIEQGQSYSYKLRSTDEDGNTSFSRTLDFIFETGFRKKIKDITFAVDRTAKKIDLAWKYDEKNIEKFVIYRSKKDEKPTIIKTLDGNTLQFTDKTVNIGNVYEYRIKAAMVNGAESIISSPISVEY
jgi:hypothetical protein